MTTLSVIAIFYRRFYHFLKNGRIFILTLAISLIARIIIFFAILLRTFLFGLFFAHQVIIKVKEYYNYLILNYVRSIARYLLNLWGHLKSSFFFKIVNICGFNNVYNFINFFWHNATRNVAQMALTTPQVIAISIAISFMLQKFIDQVIHDLFHPRCDTSRQSPFSDDEVYTIINKNKERLLLLKDHENKRQKRALLLQAQEAERQKRSLALQNKSLGNYFSDGEAVINCIIE